MPGRSETMTDQQLQAGIYRHYKGNEYEVIGIASHSESEESLVVYRPLYGEGKLWVRPLDMFTELVNVDGKQIPRFKCLGEIQESND